MTIDLDLNPQANLKTLVARLENHGVEVPGLTRWQELHELVRTDPPAPALPEDLLGQTVEQMSAWAEKYALHYVTMNSQAQRRADPYHYAKEQIRGQLDGALIKQIRDSAGSIIAGLRPAFDEAANVLRYARSLGVRDTDTIETLFHASDAKRNAWTAAKSHAATLDEIFETRQILSTVADVPPTLEFEIGREARRDVLEMGRPSGVNWTVAVVKPELAHQVSLQPLNHDAPWQRWLMIADHLELADPKPENRNDPATFQRLMGMTPQQAAAQAKGMGETAAAEVAAVNAARRA